jgi:F-type H+-transporting ATPase subunit b
MPQFDSSTFASQIFWLVVTFVALYFVLARTVLPKIGQVLEARQGRIDDDLERATHLEQEAKEALAAYEAALEAARAEAQTVVREAAEEMDAEAAKRHEELGEKLAAEVKAAEARISGARDEALANIRQVASETAQAATRRLIGVEVEETRAEAAVAAVVEERS